MRTINPCIPSTPPLPRIESVVRGPKRLTNLSPDTRLRFFYCRLDQHSRTCPLFSNHLYFSRFSGTKHIHVGVAILQPPPTTPPPHPKPIEDVQVIPRGVHHSRNVTRIPPPLRMGLYTSHTATMRCVGNEGQHTKSSSSPFPQTSTGYTASLGVSPFKKYGCVCD